MENIIKTCASSAIANSEIIRTATASASEAVEDSRAAAMACAWDAAWGNAATLVREAG